MAKRKEETPPPGSPAWMATFSDLMNLLLCFFVLLYSMSTVDESKLAKIVAAMNDTFSVFDAGATSIGDGILISNGVSQLNELSEYINSAGATADSSQESDNLEKYENMTYEQLAEALKEQGLSRAEQTAELVQEAIDESGMTEQIEVTFTSQYVELEINGALLFDSGSAELKTESYRYLDKAAVILERYSEGTIEILGHTDNVPMISRRYEDNEDLSGARARSVFYYLTEHSMLDPVNIKHAGMGERAPIADNSTPEGRSRNRRVEIRIYNPS